MVATSPEPAFIKVNKDIPLLASMWDDASPAWRGISVTVVLGHHIPLKLWPRLYRYWKPAVWRAKKGEWLKWKVSLQPKRNLASFSSLCHNVCSLLHSDTFKEPRQNSMLLLLLTASCFRTPPSRRPSPSRVLPTTER
jgi:hypothetical protein